MLCSNVFVPNNLRKYKNSNIAESFKRIDVTELITDKRLIRLKSAYKILLWQRK